MAKRLIPTDGIQLALPLTPGSETDTFAVVDPFYSLGGLRTADFRSPTDVPIWDVTITYVTGERVRVGTDVFYEALRGSTGATPDPNGSTDDWELLVSPLSYRDTIPIRRRQLGMIVFIQPEILNAGAPGIFGANRYYKLIGNADLGDLTDSSWEELLTTNNILLSDATNFAQDITTQEALDDLAIRIKTFSSGNFQGNWDATGVPQLTSGTTYEDGDFWRITVSADTDILNVGGVPSTTVSDGDLIYYIGTGMPMSVIDLTDFEVLDVTTTPVDISDLIHDVTTDTITNDGNPSDFNNFNIRRLIATDASGTDTPAIVVQEDESNTPSISISNTGVLHTDSRIIRLGENTPNGDGRINLPPVSGAISADSPIVIRDFLNTLNDYVGIHLSNLFGGVSLRGDWDPNTGVVPIIPPMITLADGDFWRASADLTGSLTVGGVDYDTDPDTDPPLISENDLIYYSGGDSGDLANYFIVGPDGENTSDLIRSLNPNIFEDGGGNNTNIQRIRYTTVHGHDKFVQVIKEDPINNPSVQIHADSDGVGRLTTDASRITLGAVLSDAEGLITGLNTPNVVADTAGITIHKAIDDLNDADARDMDLGSGFTGAGTSAIINADSNDSVRNVINSLNNDTFTTIQNLTFKGLIDTPSTDFPDGRIPGDPSTLTSNLELENTIVVPAVNGSSENLTFAPIMSFRSDTTDTDLSTITGGLGNPETIIAFTDFVDDTTYDTGGEVPWYESPQKYQNNINTVPNIVIPGTVTGLEGVNGFTISSFILVDIVREPTMYTARDIQSINSFTFAVTGAALIQTGIAVGGVTPTATSISFTTAQLIQPGVELTNTQLNDDTILAIGQWHWQMVAVSGNDSNDRRVQITINAPITRTALSDTAVTPTIQINTINITTIEGGTVVTNTLAEFAAVHLPFQRPSFSSFAVDVLTGPGGSVVTRNNNNLQSFTTSLTRLALRANDYRQPISFNDLTSVDDVPNGTIPLSDPSVLPDASAFDDADVLPGTDSTTVEFTLANDDRINIASNVDREFSIEGEWTYNAIFGSTPLNATRTRTATLSYPLFGFDVWSGTLPSSYDLRLTGTALTRNASPDIANITLADLQNGSGTDTIFNDVEIIDNVTDLTGNTLNYLATGGTTVVRVLIIRRELVETNPRRTLEFVGDGGSMVNIIASMGTRLLGTIEVDGDGISGVNLDVYFVSSENQVFSTGTLTAGNE